MVKNVKGGSRHKKAKKYSGPSNEKIVMRDENCNEHYAYVSRAYGNGQFGVHIVETNNENTMALTEREFRGRISGRMRKQKYRNFVRTNDLVLISKREFQTDDQKVDIIHVYKHDAMKKLAKMGYVPLIENLQNTNDNTQPTFIFSNEDDTMTLEPENDVVQSIDSGKIVEEIGNTEWEIDIGDI